MSTRSYWRSGAASLLALTCCCSTTTQAPAAPIPETWAAQTRTSDAKCSQNGSARTCSFDLIREEPCVPGAACSFAKISDSAAFIGGDNSSIWKAYRAAFEKVLGADPFGASFADSEVNEVCVERKRLKSKLVADVYEETRYCATWFEHAIPELGNNQRGMRIKVTLVVSLNANPNAAYREPSTAEMASYVGELRKAYTNSIAAACGSLGKSAQGSFCDAR